MDTASGSGRQTEIQRNPSKFAWNGQPPCLQSKVVVKVTDSATQSTWTRLMPCQNWDCPDCGKKMRGSLRSKLRAGLLRAATRQRKSTDCGLFTVTFRTKRASETWARYLSRNGLCDDDAYVIRTGYSRLPACFKEQREELVDNKRRAIVLEHYLDRVDAEYGTAGVVFARFAVMTRQDFARLFTRYWQLFTRRYEIKFGERLVYFQSYEHTKQDTPHWHTCFWSFSWTNHERNARRRWMVKNWLSLTPWEDAERQWITFRGERHGNGKKITDFMHAYNYALGYVGKAENPVPSGIRRFRRSRDWVIPEVGSIGKFIAVPRGVEIPDDPVTTYDDVLELLTIPDVEIFDWMRWRSVKARWLDKYGKEIPAHIKYFGWSGYSHLIDPHDDKDFHELFRQRQALLRTTESAIPRQGTGPYPEGDPPVLMWYYWRDTHELEPVGTI